MSQLGPLRGRPACGPLECMDEQLRWLDGLAQADLVRAQKASPAELEAEARERMRRRRRSGHRAPRARERLRRLRPLRCGVFGFKPSRGLVPTGCVLFERGARVGAGEYLAGAEEFQRFSRRTARFFADIDVWLTPTVGGPPVPLGTLAGTEEESLRGEKAAGAASSSSIPSTPTSRAAPP